MRIVNHLLSRVYVSTDSNPRGDLAASPAAHASLPSSRILELMGGEGIHSEMGSPLLCDRLCTSFIPAFYATEIDSDVSELQRNNVRICSPCNRR